MYILHRYILREHIIPFFLAFLVIIFILIVDLILEMMDLLLGKGIGIMVVLELFFLSLAWMVALAVPMAVLVATLMAFGRLSADNEITAIRASGVSIYKLITPALLASLVLALLLVAFNDRVLPEFNHRFRNLASDLRRKKPALVLKDKEGIFINDFENYSVLFEKIDQRRSKVYGVTIYERKGEGFPVPIRAERGELGFSQDGNHLTLTLYNGEIHQIDQDNPRKYLRTTFKKHVIHIPDVGQSLARTESKTRLDREMSIGMMLEKIRTYQQEIEEHQNNIDRSAREYMDQYLPAGIGIDYSPPLVVSSEAFKSSSSETYTWPLNKATEGVIERIHSETKMIEHKRRNINRYSVEIHKKFSIPAACPVFVLIGVPLAIMFRRGGPGVGIGVSLGFFVLYWAFLIGGEGLADRGLVPPSLAMWAANIVIGAAGLYLIIHTAKETTFIRWTWAGRAATQTLRRLKRLKPHPPT